MTRMGVATVEGLQGDDVGAPGRVAACGKHFYGYSVPRSGRDRSPAWIPEHVQREYFLAPFKAALDDLLIELADAREAQRSYEANLKMFDQTRQMQAGLMDLLRR